MKSIVIYFSQTGNTEKVARAIHKGINRILAQSEIAPLKQFDPQDLSGYDLIGLGSPVFMSGLEPRNLREFINNISYSLGKHVFLFCTHAEKPERYFPSVIRLVKEKGLTIIGMRDWYGGSNLPCFPCPSYTHGHPDEIDLKEAENFGREMVEISRRILAGETNLILTELPPLTQINIKEIHKGLGLPPGRSIHGTVKYNQDKCLYPKCRLCVDNCPFGFIDLSASPPKFGDRPGEIECEDGCAFCELICPTGAISGDWEFGLEFCRKNKSDFEEALVKAEAEGRFRRLVPVEKVGWDTPYYKVHSKRPRCKIPKDV